MSNTPDVNEEEYPELAAQRRSLDVMSANLTHNLNLMIAEQERRVQEFAAQHSGTPVVPAEFGTTTEQASLPKRSTNARPSRSSVTPPPARKSSAVTETPRRRVPEADTPPPPLPSVPRGKQAKEGKIGMGPIIVFIVIVVMLLRACD